MIRKVNLWLTVYKAVNGVAGWKQGELYTPLQLLFVEPFMVDTEGVGDQLDVTVA